MAHGRIERRTWHDERFRSWDLETRHLWIYLLSSPHGNMIGCYVLDPMYAAADTGIELVTVESAFDVLREAGRIEYDHTVNLLLIRNYLRYQSLQNPNVVRGACNVVRGLPYSEKVFVELIGCLEREWEDRYQPLHRTIINRLETVAKPSANRPSPPATSHQPPAGNNHVPQGGGENRTEGRTSVGEGSYPTLSNLSRNGAGHREYPEPFEELWEVYPERRGNSNKGGAYRKWRANLQKGISHADMLEGVLSYREFLRQEGKIGSKFVKMAKTFLGPEEHFREDWLDQPEQLDDADRQILSKYRRLTSGGPDEQPSRRTG